MFRLSMIFLSWRVCLRNSWWLMTIRRPIPRFIPRLSVRWLQRFPRLLTAIFPMLKTGIRVKNPKIRWRRGLRATRRLRLTLRLIMPTPSGSIMFLQSCWWRPTLTTAIISALTEKDFRSRNLPNSNTPAFPTRCRSTVWAPLRAKPVSRPVSITIMPISILSNCRAGMMAVICSAVWLMENAGLLSLPHRSVGEYLMSLGSIPKRSTTWSCVQVSVLRVRRVSALIRIWIH